MNKTVFTPNCRLSFCDLFVPKPDMNGKVGFRAELLFPKTITMTQLAEMRALHDASVPAKWIAAGEDYRKFNQCFIDGDKKKQEGRKGHYMLRTQSGEDHPPRVKLANNATAKPGQLYAGANVRALLSCFSWTSANEKGVIVSRGVSFNLLVIQLVNNEGQPFGNFVSDEEIEEALASRPLQAIEGEELLG